MLRKENDALLCECTGCGTKVYAGSKSLEALIDTLRQKCWRIRRVGEEWCHWCEECIAAQGKVKTDSSVKKK